MEKAANEGDLATLKNLMPQLQKGFAELKEVLILMSEEAHSENTDC